MSITIIYVSTDRNRTVGYNTTVCWFSVLNLYLTPVSDFDNELNENFKLQLVKIFINLLINQ